MSDQDLTYEVGEIVHDYITENHDCEIRNVSWADLQGAIMRDIFNLAVDHQVDPEKLLGRAYDYWAGWKSSEGLAVVE